MRSLIVSLVLFIMLGCNNNESSNIKSFNLEELPEITSPKLSDFGFIDIEYIPLETNQRSQLSYIYNIEFGDDFFIPYRFGPFSVSVFDTIGNLINNFVTIGRGPNEMRSVDDVKIDKRTQQIYVSSGSSWNFNVYSETGEFLRKFEIPFKENPVLVTFSIIDDKILCYYENHMGKQEYSYTIMDLNGNNIKEFPNKYPFKNKSSYGFPQENFFYKYNNKLYVKEVYSDTIYLFNEEKVEFEPHMVIDVGDRLITPEARSILEPEGIAKNYINPWYLFEFGDYIFYGFTYELIVKFPQPIEKTCGYIGSKKDDFQVLYDLEKGIINDLDGGPPIMPLTTRDDNTVVAGIDAFKLKNYVLSNKFKNSSPKYPEKKEELEKLAENLKETDNPVIILISLKK